MKEEIIKEVLDIFINLLEFKTILENKNLAVRKQDFEEAANWRDKEVEILAKLPSLEKLKELRDKL